MEPADLKHPGPDDRQLEAWLRDQPAQPPLPDDGFTARVMAALPPAIDCAALAAARHQAASRRVWLCFLGAVTGLIVARLAAPAATLDGAAGEVAAVLQQLSAGARQIQSPSLPLALGLTFAALLWIYLPPVRLWRRLTG
jgi:hypothetical protein